jgi:hypothetical protein
MEDVKTVGKGMVPRAGVEPARPFGQRILSPQRLPFRHPGMLSRNWNYTKNFRFSKILISIGNREGWSDAVAILLGLYRIPVLPHEIKSKNHHRCY